LLSVKNEDYTYCVSPTIYLFRHTLELGLKILNNYIFEFDIGLKEHDLKHLTRKYPNKGKIIVNFSDKEEEYIDKILLLLNKKLNLDKKILKKYGCTLKKINLNDFIQLSKDYCFDKNNTKFRYYNKLISGEERPMYYFNKINKDIEILKNLGNFLRIIILIACLKTKE
jgi:hypothetical protein